MIGGTILGRIGGAEGTKAAHLDFSIRPAGKGAPRIDPKPILDGWKLLEATAIYRASGATCSTATRRPTASRSARSCCCPSRCSRSACSRTSASRSTRAAATTSSPARSTGACSRRSPTSPSRGCKPTATSLKCGHGFFTTSGNVSEHSSGNAVDIAKVNGIPILGHQEPGGITEQTVRRLMHLQGTMEPHQIISLLELGGATFAMADHADHIHVGFQPLFGANGKLGKQALAVLKPGQWSDLLKQLRKIDNPVVPTKPSKYAIPVKPKRASDAHQGE